MANPNNIDVPKIEENPLPESVQQLFVDKYNDILKKYPAESPQSLSFVVAVFRDGLIVPFSAIDASGKSVAAEYNLPVNLGTVHHATALAVVSAEPTAGVIKASGWYNQGGKHRCNGG